MSLENAGSKYTIWLTKSKLETPSNSETSQAKEGNHKYDSLKFYREGPNPESGELDSKAGSEEVKKHNISVTERHDKA